MNTISKKPLEELGRTFVAPEYLPAGADEYYLRRLQTVDGREYRSLTAGEIEELVKNENTADDWTAIRVDARFDTQLVKRCEFHGMVRIGALERVYLEFHDLRLPVGLYDSTIVSCDIGSNVVIDNVRYLAHYIIGNEVILLSINEMLTTDHSKFGNGIIKEGEQEDVRIWLEIGNENGGRRVLPFDGMLPGDAYLWEKYRDDEKLMARFVELTNTAFDRRRGFYGTVGDRSIVKHCRILKDVKIGTDAYIKGANKLKNLTINSCAEAETQIGEGVELVNGIIGFGCRVFYGVKAVRFVMGSNSSLKYGARLINSILGDNSTISCCEVLNSLIFPGHEQHHNNSFLCAATLLGQTNVAAGATIGSNHNSRGSDGEIRAGRGFWPGLCVSLKHNSRFASFTLLVKGAYPAELDIVLPFSLVSNNESERRIQILPAYWFSYNMYALARNSWKYAARDRRAHKHQRLEFDWLAPDTVEEILTGMSLLEQWTGRAYLLDSGKSIDEMDAAELANAGRKLLLESPSSARRLVILGDGVESSDRPALILKAVEGYAAYWEMASFYGASSLIDVVLSNRLQFEDLTARFGTSKRGHWINVGGQLIRERDVTRLRENIANGTIPSWDAVHAEYLKIGDEYPLRKAEHAFACVAELLRIEPASVLKSSLLSLFDSANLTMQKIARLTRESREKDYENRFRRMVYDSQEEMEAVIGTIDNDSFVKHMAAEAESFSLKVARAKECL